MLMFTHKIVSNEVKTGMYLNINYCMGDYCMRDFVQQDGVLLFS